MHVCVCACVRSLTCECERAWVLSSSTRLLSSNISDSLHCSTRRPVRSTRQQYYEQAAKFLLQEGGKHWACRHPSIVRELLWLWLFPSQSSVQFLQKTLATQVSECLQCAVALHTQRSAALDSASTPDLSSASASDQGRQNALRDAVRVWDSARLTANFEEFGANKAHNAQDDYSRRLQGTLCSHVEFLLQPQLLLLDHDAGKRLNAAFSLSLSALVQGDFCISGAHQLPGLYLLCVHSSSAIRGWARAQVRSRATLEHPAHFAELHQVFDMLVHHIERLTMIRNGCDEDDQAGPVQPPLPQSLSDDEREVWTGLMVATRQLSPWIVRDRLMPRYRALLPLAFMSVMENSAAVLPAAQFVHHLQRCLGRTFWQVSTFSAATFRRVLANLATNSSAIVPVRHISLELLEEVLVTASQAGSRGGGNGEGAVSIADDIASFLSSRKLRSGAAAHTAVSAMATRVLIRVLQRLLDRGGLAELPLVSSTEWAPHVVGTACSPNLPELSRSPAALVLARIIRLQTANIEAALYRSIRSAESQDSAVHDSAMAAGAHRKAQTEDRGVTNSAMWLDSVWCWLLEKAGTETIPEQVHVALLESGRTLLIWPHQSGGTGDSSSVILRRYTALIIPYLQSLARLGHGGLAATLARNVQTEQLIFELALIQQAEANAAVRELAYCALGLGNDLVVAHGMVPALQALASTRPTALAAGIRAACAHVQKMGLDGAGFDTLHHLFLWTGHMVPTLLTPLLAESRHELLQAVWDLTQAFVECRSRLRTESVMKRQGQVALDATASSFFSCFRALWPHFATLVSGAADVDAPSDDHDFDDRQHQSLASAHAQWLPAFAKVHTIYRYIATPCVPCLSLLPHALCILQCGACNKRIRVACNNRILVACNKRILVSTCSFQPGSCSLFLGTRHND